MYKIKYQLLIIASVLLVACGGGGDGGGTSDDIEEAITAETGDETGNGSNGNDGEGDQVFEESTGDESMGPQNDSIEVLSRLAVLDVEPFSEVFEAHTKSSGHFVLSGGGSISSSGVVIAGDTSSRYLVVEPGDTISGLPPSIVYNDSIAVRAERDGTVYVLLETQGASERMVLASGGLDGLTLVSQTGDSFTDLNGGERTLSAISEFEVANGSVLMSIDGDSALDRYLASLSNGAIEVIASRNSNDVNAPVIEPGCPFSFEKASFRDRNNFAVADDGTAVIEVQLQFPAFSTVFSCRGSAIVRRAPGDTSFETVVGVDDSVPGAPASAFAGLDLYSVNADGAIIFNATITTPTGEREPDSKSSWWVAPVGGQLTLIALEGESVEIASGQTFTLPADVDRYEVAYRNGQAVVIADIGDSQEVLIAGAIATGAQPHANVSAPGASALQALVSTLDSPLPGLPDSRFINDLTLPNITATDEVVAVLFFSDAIDEDFMSESLSSFDSTGVRSDIVMSGDGITRLTSPKVVKRVGSSIGASSVGRATIQTPLDDGGFIFSGTFDDDLERFRFDFGTDGLFFVAP